MSTDPTVGTCGGVRSSSEVRARTLTPNDGPQAVPAAPFGVAVPSGLGYVGRESPGRIAGRHFGVVHVIVSELSGELQR